MSFPAKGHSVTLLMQDMGRRGGSDDGGNQSPESKKTVMHDEDEPLSKKIGAEGLRGSRGLFMHACLRMQEEERVEPDLVLTFRRSPYQSIE